MRLGSWCWLSKPLFSLLIFISIFPAAAQNLPLIASPSPALGQSSAPGAGSGLANVPITAAAPANSPGSFDEVIDRVVEREHLLMAQMRNLRPMVETYIQNLKPDASGNGVPVNDEYFLGRLEMNDRPNDISFKEQPRSGKRGLRRLSALYSLRFHPLGFAQMIVPDNDLDKRHHHFNYVHREFLGAVRCLVIDVRPREDAPRGRFEGRIWVEDQDYSIVRFDGTYVRPKWNEFYLHFDSWRLNLRPGMWLPAYIYSEETALASGVGRARVKAQTRLWGYDLNAVGSNYNEEFAQILIDPQTARDHSDAAADPVPVVAERLWERQGEDNVVARLQTVGLLAPPGEVDKVLQTVINNLLVTNDIDLQSEVRCRVLITAPLESFTIGHTIVLSRGLLDVLPDEASLAFVLAHELSHMGLGHYFDTKIAFNDRMFFPDQRTFRRLDFKRRPEDEAAADAKALELLKNSPYKDKLSSAGLFLRALQQRAPDLPNLIRPHLGDSLAGQSIRMAGLLAASPRLDEQSLDQIAALPLGGRIKLDPWTDQVELAKARPVTLALAREKMPFEVTPFFPYLTRLTNDHIDKEALLGSSSK
jgi:hypothetical protein